MRRRTCLLAALSIVAVLLSSLPIRAGAQPSAATGDVTIVSKSGEHVFHVEIVSTPDDMARGLMFRKSLAPDAGMLFDYGHPQPASFWMKNTLIPLDMIFIGADGRIVNIHERAVPHSLDPIPSDGPVRAVLEVNGGTASRLRIKPGDRVVNPIFGKAG